ncbi:rhodanese-like domain-containing protein [Enterovirga rhinocerotis]|uniref:rhodanese-like domain-containing protein n=1 Tax=Enterovirga rhinocerotis TaxID=1339210 RepID=UPI003CCB64B6
MTVDEVIGGIEDGTMIVVDVREPRELAAGMIPGSVAMPLSEFDPAGLPVDDGRRIVFVCAGGVRSRIAIEAARQAGIDVREHLAPGFKGWVAQGGAVALPT